MNSSSPEDMFTQDDMATL